MNKFSLNTLAGKLFVVSALVILFTVGVISFSGYWLAKTSIADEVQRRVFCVRSERQERVELWFKATYNSLNYFINSAPLVEILIDDLISVDDKTKKLGSHLSKYRDYFDSIAYCRIALIDGSVVSQIGGDNIDGNINELIVFKQAKLGNYNIGPIHMNGEGMTVFNIGMPIVYEGKPIAIFICQMYSSKSIEPILMDTSGLGWSGESFLIGADTLMLTPSRFYNHPEPLTHKMPIPTALLALQGKKGVMVYHGFLGKEVVGAYGLLEDTGWALITEMVADEAFAPLKSVARNTAIVSGLALIMMLYLSVILSRNWTRPLEQLASASMKVAEGDLTVHMAEDKRKDEIGTLTRHFNHMVKSIAESRLKLEQSHNRLTQSEKMAAIGELVTGIVHEMRNPLSVIKMNLNLIQRKPENSTEKDPVIAEQIELASMEANQLEKMLSELLDFSKPITLKKEILSMRNIFDKSIRSIRQSAIEAGIEVIFKTSDSSDIEVFADEDSLNILLVNLLLNAVQASEHGSKVEVWCGLNKDNLKIQISDTGVGMSSKIKDRILDPFFTTRDDGTGLGLSNVKKIVDLYGGSIKIESEEKKGTKFIIELCNVVNHG